MNTLHSTLSQLGLNTKETSAYLAMLKLGQATITQIAEDAELRRTTAYLVVEGLERKGFASRVQGKTLAFLPLHPQKLLALEKSKIQSLEFSLPGLLGLACKAEQKPSVRFFTGSEGIVAVYEESLLLEPNAEILALGHAQAVESKLPKFRSWYIKRRVKLGIRMRALTPATPGGFAVAGRDKTELRQTRILKPEQFSEQVEMNIYKNKVALVSLVEKELIGMITESSVFANMHRQIFEMLWSLAKPMK